MRSPLVAAATGLLLTACAGGSSGPGPASAPAPAPPPAAATVMQQAAQAAQTAQAEPPKPKSMDPTGVYYVSLSYGGMPLAVTLQITKRTDAAGYGGAISVDQVPQPIPLNTIEVAGKRVVATLSTPDGATVTLDLTIEGLDVSGSYKSSTGDGSPVTGKKVP